LDGTSQVETKTPKTADTRAPAETKNTLEFRNASWPKPFTIASAVMALKAIE
jgi:hypothetical protein